MEIGIGLPNAVRGVKRHGIVDWAQRAEAARFASLGTIDRIAYPNFESIVALAAAAAVTERIRLVTDILILPLRTNTALSAKQTATIDALSGGRLELGLAVGGRADDYELSGADFTTRGASFDRQLAELTELWAGDEVGPDPANGKRPGLLIGGQSDKAFRRAAKYADGWTMGGGGPDAFTAALGKLRSAWSEAGREGEPRTSALFYFSLGPRRRGRRRAQPRRLLRVPRRLRAADRSVGGEGRRNAEGLRRRVRAGRRRRGHPLPRVKRSGSGRPARRGGALVS